MNHNPLVARLQLVLSLTRREWLNQYAGTRFGLLWTLASPLLLMSIYSLVFVEFFSAKWPGFEDSKYFAMNLFLGLIVHTAAATSLNKATTIIQASQGTLNNIQFPAHTFVFSCVFGTIPQLVGSMIVLLALLLLIGHEFTWALLLTPLVILPLYITIVGICLIIASASVYLRDLAQVMPFATTAMLFMSPVFYTIEAIPPPYHQIVQLNFLTIPIEFLRQLIITGSVIDLPLLGIYSALSFIAYFLGRYIFKRLSYGFTDVL